MSKYDIGVGEAFELDESQASDDCRGRHGRRHRHHHDHDHDHDHPHDHDGHRHGHHGHGHHHMHMAALAMLFALKAHRRAMRAHGEE